MSASTSSGTVLSLIPFSPSPSFPSWFEPITYNIPLSNEFTVDKFTSHKGCVVESAGHLSNDYLERTHLWMRVKLLLTIQTQLPMIITYSVCEQK